MPSKFLLKFTYLDASRLRCTSSISSSGYPVCLLLYLREPPETPAEHILLSGARYEINEYKHTCAYTPMHSWLICSMQYVHYLYRSFARKVIALNSSVRTRVILRSLSSSISSSSLATTVYHYLSCYLIPLSQYSFFIYSPSTASVPYLSVYLLNTLLMNPHVLISSCINIQDIILIVAMLSLNHVYHSFLG
jgi:hypothetical protein